MTARTRLVLVPTAGHASQRRTDGNWHRGAWTDGRRYYTDCDGELRTLGGTRHTPGDTIRPDVPRGGTRCARCWR